MIQPQLLHNYFDIEYDSIDSFDNPSYTPEEKDRFLNDAQDRLIQNVKRGGVERIQTFRDYLANITDNENISTFVTNADNHTNGVFAVLPDNYRTMLEERVTTSYTDCHGDTVTAEVIVDPITHDEYGYAVKSPFKKPKATERVLSLPFGMLTGETGQTVELLTDGTFTVSNYRIRYIREPQTIQYGTVYATPVADQACELNLEGCKWVAKEAAMEAFRVTNQLEKNMILTRMGEPKI